MPTETRRDHDHPSYDASTGPEPGAATPRRSQWKLGLLVAGMTTLLLAIVVAVGGELAVRRMERTRTTVPGSMPLLYYRHARLGHALVRNYGYFGWNNVDSSGFRGARQVTEAKTPGVVRVMVVGGSTTFDPYVTADEKAWPARLEHWLGELAPDRRVEVINAGVPGYRVMQDLTRLQTELHRYSPDVVILYQGHNDLYNALVGSLRPPRAPRDTPDEVPVVTPWTHWLSRNSVLYTKVAERLIAMTARSSGTKARGRDDTEARLARGIDDGAAQFARDVALYAASARTLGIRLVVPEIVHASGVNVSSEPDSALRALWRGAITYADPDLMLRGYTRYTGVLRTVAEKEGAAFVPTGSFGLRGAQWYADGDPIHFNDRGADRMGEQMARALLAAGLLDAAPSSGTAAVASSR